MTILLKSLSLILTISIFVLIIWRILLKSGIKLKKDIIVDSKDGFEPSNKECVRVFIYSLLFRVFTIIVGAIICFMFSESATSIHLNSIIGEWEKWDANNYIRIAEGGYSAYQENGDYTTLVFFPLYPFLIKLVSLLGIQTNISGLIVSMLCYSIACVFLYKLVALDYRKETAEKSVILMSIFPFAFFYSAIMSESTFLMTSIMAMYFVRKHNWMSAGIMGMLCALSRSVGVFLIFPATVEFLEETKLLANLKDIKGTLMCILKKWLWLLLFPLGTCIYLYINYYIAGNPLEFLRLQELIWDHKSQPFFITIGELWRMIKTYSSMDAISMFAPAFITLVGIFTLIICSIRKHRTMYLTWLIVYIIVCSSISWPISLARYLACAIPAFIFLADMCSKNKKLDMSIIVSFSILYGIYLTGYLTWKPIM